jgi:hypothetical protein
MMPPERVIRLTFLVLFFYYSNLARAADTCIGNDYTGNDKFCLVSRDRVGYHCGVAQAFVLHLRLVCNPGTRNAGGKWDIVCKGNNEDDARVCNLNVTELCSGLSQWNPGQHCTEGGSSPNGHW